MELTRIAALATNPHAAPAVRDILDQLRGLPKADAIEHLRTAQVAIGQNAWELSDALRVKFTKAIEETIEATQ